MGVVHKVRAVFAGAGADIRLWTEASTGRTVRGQFIRLDSQATAWIKIRDWMVPIPIARLSAPDQRYIAARSSSLGRAPRHAIAW